MHSRFMLIAALVASLATPAVAEPGKIVAQQVSQPTARPAQILLAQADIRTSQQSDGQVAQADSAPPADSQAPAPAKRRASRVTTCRCAGQTPQQP